VWSETARRRFEQRNEPGFEDYLFDDSDGTDPIAMAGKWLWRAGRRRFLPVKPRGVSRGMAPPPHLRTFEGVVRRRDGIQLAPFSGRRCLAFGVLFTHLTSVWRSAVTLRDAVAVEFDIELNDGSTVRVPGGRVRLSLRATETIRPRARALREYLAEVDPLHARSEGLQPYPFQRVGEVLVRPGQRVEIRGTFEPMPDPSVAERGLSYRAAPPTILVATGTPWLRPRGRAPSAAGRG